jgi:LacI family transcriptional regulator
MTELLKSKREFTAVFAGDDMVAAGALRAIADTGLRVPGDISVVGYNDIPLAARLPVPLSSVHTAFDQIAATAIELLLSPAGSSGAIRSALPTLIPRSSTGRPTTRS